MLPGLEHLTHCSLPKQPDCLVVQLYEGHNQDAHLMVNQEMLKEGSVQHLWANLSAYRFTEAVLLIIRSFCNHVDDFCLLR